MDHETRALVQAQRFAIVGLIQLLDAKKIFDKSLVVDFLEEVKACYIDNDENDPIAGHLVSELEQMVTSINSERGWKPTVIPGGKK
jgi:hypothetical protein